MLLINATCGPRVIGGLGLFAHETIPAGTEIWRFVRWFDVQIPIQRLAELPPAVLEQITASSFWSPMEQAFLLSSDDARFINHSRNPNACLVATSTFAICTIPAGEEITLDLRRFIYPPVAESWQTKSFSFCVQPELLPDNSFCVTEWELQNLRDEDADRLIAKFLEDDSGATSDLNVWTYRKLEDFAWKGSKFAQRIAQTGELHDLIGSIVRDALRPHSGLIYKLTIPTAACYLSFMRRRLIWRLKDLRRKIGREPVILSLQQPLGEESDEMQLEDVIKDENAVDPAAAVEMLEAREILRELCSLLSETDFELAQMWARRESYEAMAEKLRIPINTVASRINRLKAKLRKLGRDREGDK